ncbi:MAG: transferrin-binding protein-like solute binding protein [Rhizobiaceae bacterium]|nr:transferrin-binding protein-like solute binding protein [Rhizobiaceae bacterium]
MKHLAGLASAAALALLAGCGGNSANQPDLTTQTVSVRGHGMALNRSATGAINGVYDRSDGSQGGSLVTTLSNGIATSVNVDIQDRMEGNTDTPDTSNLKVDSGNLSTFRNGDTFLTRVKSGANYTADRYTVNRDNLQHTFFLVGGTKTGNMPSTGSATYTGSTSATVFGSASQSAEVTGSAHLTANFLGGGGTIQGRLYNLDGPLYGTDILLNQRSIQGSNFQNGELSLVTAGTNANVGNLTGSDYQGSFFGGGAGEVAGTFQFGAQNVPNPAGGTQSLQGVGSFGAAK